MALKFPKNYKQTKNRITNFELSIYSNVRGLIQYTCMYK